MNSDKPEVLFIQGVAKTATSTVVGILNCHPGIFMLYETHFGKPGVSKYGNQLIKTYPETRRYFRSTTDLAQLYSGFAEFIQGKHPETPYKYIGDKLIDIDPDLTQRGDKVKTIFALRDIRSWLCKKQIVELYRPDTDIIPVILEYMRYVLGTYKYPHCLRITMENLIQNNEQVIQEMETFLDIDLTAHTSNWWEKIGDYPENDPKASVKWFIGHASSKVKPGRLDTTIELTDHAVWDKTLPIFDKYYTAGSSTSFPEEEIENDLNELEKLLEYSPLPLSQCYKNISTESLGKKPKRSFFKRVFNIR